MCSNQRIFRSFASQRICDLNHFNQKLPNLNNVHFQPAVFFICPSPKSIDSQPRAPRLNIWAASNQRNINKSINQMPRIQDLRCIGFALSTKRADAKVNWWTHDSKVLGMARTILQTLQPRSKEPWHESLLITKLNDTTPIQAVPTAQTVSRTPSQQTHRKHVDETI